MGREIKRVPLDFNWPLDQRWKGFIPPPDGTAHCQHCRGIDGHPTGYSRLGNAVYAMASREAERPILPPNAFELTSEEQRFMEALSRSVAPEHRRMAKRTGMQPYVIGHTVTDPRFLCYDIMQHLAKTLRVSMKKTFMCKVCKGAGTIVSDPKQAQLAKKWRRKGPPKGKGWQVWETVSEGSPVTPVFATPEELIDYLCTVGDTGVQMARTRGWEERLPTREQATAFVMGSGWVPSAVFTRDADGTVRSLVGVQVAEVFQEGAAE